jgi:hypothetical protein
VQILFFGAESPSGARHLRRIAPTDHSGRHVASYNAGVAVGVAAGRLLRRRRHDDD